MKHTEAWGKRKGKRVHPNTHDFMYFLTGEFYHNTKLAEK